jgi:proteasome lid subunit RPN8/RPN11
MRISRALYDEMIAHAREEAPNECCGMVAARDGEAVKVYRAANATEARLRHLRFEIDPREQIQIHNAMEAEGLDLGVIYHSHTRTAPNPSPTDVNFAQQWPGVIWVIVGLAGDAPEVKAWLLDDNRITEAELVVE